MSTEFLEQCVRTGSIDVSQWPTVLPLICERLEQIAKTDFPPPLAAELFSAPHTNTPATAISTGPTHSSTSQSTIPDTSLPSSQPAPSSPPPPPAPAPTDPLPQGTLHPEDTAFLNSLLSTLTNTFPTAPPHTYQRLFELILNPRAHYTALPKWLRAVSRTLSVSSPSTIFPLPITEAEAMMTANTNGAGAGVASFMDMDESLGGALLTPIPWLEGVDADAVESGAVGGISQGELLRKEQELNIVPANQVEGFIEREAAEGPPKIDAEDVGPQPEGTVFPDPPRAVEDIGDAPGTTETSAVEAGEKMEGVETTGEGKEETNEGEAVKEENGVEAEERKVKVEDAEGDGDKMDVDAPVMAAEGTVKKEEEDGDVKMEDEIKKEEADNVKTE